MKTTLQLAGLQFSFFSESELDIDSELNNFMIPLTEQADVTIRISSAWDNLTLPVSPQLGEDRICRYYREGDTWYCLTRGGSKGPVACSIYRTDCRKILCVLNEKPFLRPPENLGSILRMIPLRAVFQHFSVLPLHASRICYKDKAILFSGPSEVGKTTQARLWHKCRSARILCNDRTLLRKKDGVWCTYGYPLDGSEPVRSCEMIPLGAVVLLAQGPEERVEHLQPGRAASLLMNQSVIDVWNPDACKAAMEIILSLLEDIPVYRLTCTPDERAVEALEEILKKEGVVPVE